VNDERLGDGAAPDRGRPRPAVAVDGGTRACDEGVVTGRRSKLTIGIDEAGRGPAIGPRVLAGVALDTAAARALSRAGLADSKAFGAGEAACARRAELAAQVRARARFVAVEVVDVATVDARVLNGELNALERDVARRLLAGAPAADRVIADGHRLFAPMAAHVPGLQALDGAEARHAAVAAASVIAKDERDRAFAAIAARYHAEFGELRGGGYVNDATRAFLRAYATRYRRLPPEARRSWPHPYLDGLLDEAPPTGRQLALL
jgi:ribonuclease HII